MFLNVLWERVVIACGVCPQSLERIVMAFQQATSEYTDARSRSNRWTLSKGYTLKDLDPKLQIHSRQQQGGLAEPECTC